MRYIETILNAKLLNASANSLEVEEVKELNTLLNDYRLLMFNILPKIDSSMEKSMDTFRDITTGPIKISIDKSKKLNKKAEFKNKTLKETLDMVNKNG